MADLRVKLAILADAAKYDASCASSGSKRSNRGEGIGNSDGIGICHSYTPDGRCVSLLKVLLTNYCIYDCKYCVNRVSSDTPRARFSPQEVVKLTLEFYRRNYIEGLFLSSGIIQSPDYTMEQVIAVARSLRNEHQFHGYIHLKTAAGASPELVQEAGHWADRLSVNIELPTAGDLRALAPEKDVAAIRSTMSEIQVRVAASRRETRQGTPRFAPAGQSTQMIIGASATPDSSILASASELYSQHRMRRVYYSAYSPIPHADPRLPPAAPPLIREHRLYQADWLMRHYGYTAEEICSAGANLNLEIDPKLAWALHNRACFPVDVNRDERERLLRVPGLGVRNVERILKLRRVHRIRWSDLKKLRVSVRKAGPFVVAAGNREIQHVDSSSLARRVAPRSLQLELFDSAATARTGEL